MHRLVIDVRRDSFNGHSGLIYLLRGAICFLLVSNIVL